MGPLIDSSHPDGVIEVDAEGRRIIYRLCRAFPPMFPTDYVPAIRRRSFASQSVQVQQAASGLSVYSSITSVVTNAEKFPRLGTTVVRYRIPEISPLRIVHLIGPRTHLTVLGDPLELHAQLDQCWNLLVGTIP